MKIHYINCATMYPRGAGLFVSCLDRSPAICMLIETNDQLVLVDTGFGTRDIADTSRLGHADILLNTQKNPDQPAIRQVEKMGFAPRDVRHIICTHLDRDHAGGLSDFPDAKVHVLQVECDAALNPKNAFEKDRYRRCHFSHGPKWLTHETVSNETWFGMECIRNIPELPPEILLVPLHGHTRGHCGVAVDTGNGWVLHCGDAYYVKEELRQKGKAPIGVRVFRRLAHINFTRAMYQIDRLKSIVRDHGDEVTLIASHDQFEYRNIFGKPLD
jgi:glyoxylase-like metal-dependent hydrolase (beta-lactamase superfamily II)